jgi:steroid delta-isomerase-like uncharacterized protein
MNRRNTVNNKIMWLLASCLMVTAFILTSCGSSASNTEKLTRDIIAAWNSHDPEKFASFLIDDCVYEDVPMGVVNHGKEQVKAFVAVLFSAVPDVKMETTSLFTVGDWGACEYVMTGTQTGALGQFPATGKSFSVRGVSVVQFRNGKFSRNSNYYDMVSWLQQLGLLPAPSK